MTCLYQPDQFPDLSPPVSRMAERHGSNTNKIRISDRPAEPGRSFLRLCSREPSMRSTSGRPSPGPASARRLCLDGVDWLCCACRLAGGFGCACGGAPRHRLAGLGEIGGGGELGDHVEQVAEGGLVG